MTDPIPAAGSGAIARDDSPVFETALAELESLVATMENGSLPLEESLAAYRRGVELVRVCQARLTHVDEQVRVLEADLLRPLAGDDA